MPASRTRKKAKQKKTAEQRARTEQARIEKMRQILGPAMDAVPACMTCHGPRQAVEQADIPAERWAELEPIMRSQREQELGVRQVVYCPACDEYAVLSGWASF